jgi:hypothetical protein
MILMYILAVCSFFALFILFLVLSKTLNNVMNNLVKLQYLLQKELDYKKEQAAIAKFMEEEKATDADPGESEAPEQNSSPAPSGKPKK